MKISSDKKTSRKVNKKAPLEDPTFSPSEKKKALSFVVLLAVVVIAFGMVSTFANNVGPDLLGSPQRGGKVNNNVYYAGTKGIKVEIVSNSWSLNGGPESERPISVDGLKKGDELSFKVRYSNLSKGLIRLDNKIDMNLDLLIDYYRKESVRSKPINSTLKTVNLSTLQAKIKNPSEDILNSRYIVGRNDVVVSDGAIIKWTFKVDENIYYLDGENKFSLFKALAEHQVNSKLSLHFTEWAEDSLNPKIKNSADIKKIIY